jgi:alpha-L-fucosidase
LLSVIRDQRGYEDVITPELFVPDAPLEVPFEVCTVMGKLQRPEECISFGYTYDQDYMSAKEVAHLLLDVVAKGGNLALNIAPQPDGRLPYRAVCELKILAKWMAIFGDAIHGTRAVAPYRTGKWAFTVAKEGGRVNAFYLWEDGELVPAMLTIPYEGEVKAVRDLRSGKRLAFERCEGGISVMLPSEQVGKLGDIADCYVFE